MQLATLFLVALGASSISATPSWLTGNQVTLKEEFKVPGDNPLYFCEYPDDDILTIENVDLSPNPPQPGETLSINATGILNDQIEEGFKMRLQVKYGLITLINQEADGCDTVGKADLKCPLEKGEMSLAKDVDLPKEIPPGLYTVFANVYTDAGDKITCLTAKIRFHRTGTGDGGGIEDDMDMKAGEVKFAKTKFEMSGPLAGMVQERLRQRNEL